VEQRVLGKRFLGSSQLGGRLLEQRILGSRKLGRRLVERGELERRRLGLLGPSRTNPSKE
jgi:hypothetical protein